MTRGAPLLPVLAVIAVGAVLGAWLRWALAVWLNARSEMLPAGTLLANVVGGYLVGVAVAVLAANPALSPYWRLLIVTGFLGGLTTFSTFSAESVALLQGERWVPAAVHTAAHVFGSLAATLAGIATVRLVHGT